MPKDPARANLAVLSKSLFMRERESLSLSPSLPRHLPAALDEFDPDVVVYNAGTDILIGDPLGNLDITPEVYLIKADSMT